MAKRYISGVENIPSKASFFIPNRMDASALKQVDAALGGKRRVAFLMEEVLCPDAPVMRMITAPGRKLLRFTFREAKGQLLREQIMALLNDGYHVIFVPGKPVSPHGLISDVPKPFMMQLSALHISPVPLFVGYYRNALVNLFCTDGTYHIIQIRFCAKLTPGPLMGERLLSSWFEASTKLYPNVPILAKSLTSLMVKGMRRNPNVELVDGLDGSSLPYYKVLGVSMALSIELKRTIREPRIGIILPPGKGGCIANYACMLAGLVPVNINYTASDAAFGSIVRQSGIKKFITAKAFMTKLPNFPWPEDADIIHLDRTLKALPKSALISNVMLARFAPIAVLKSMFEINTRKGDDEAFLVFTSGSSGEPKGVIFTHRMLITNITQIMSRMQMPATSSVLCSLPIFHSFGLTFTTLTPPIAGFKMITYPSPLEHKRLNELIVEHEVRLVVSTPTFSRGMLRRATAETYKSVYYFVVGAEKLPKDLNNEFINKCGIRLCEGYGLTETSPAASVNVELRGPRPEQPYYTSGYCEGTIGQLMPGLTVRITDPDDDSKSLPLSSQGMIWFKGGNVFKGYLGQEDRRDDVFDGDWFRSGDLGSVDLNGMITLGGRRSRFSKIGGEMVPHEVVEKTIDAMLTAKLGASDLPRVAIVGVPDKLKGESMVLLSTVHASSFTETLKEIRDYMVADGQPRLWVPREICPVEAIPILGSGKMDLKGCELLAHEALGIST